MLSDEEQIKWSDKELTKLRDLRIDPVRSQSWKLTALVNHFKGGGSTHQVHKKGNPVKASKALAIKIKNATDDSSLDWLLARNKSEGVAVIDEVAWPTIPEEWPHGFLNNGEILRGDAAMRWSTDRPQQAGDEFLLDLGKEIPINKIRFLQGIQHQWDHPKRWHMTLSNVHLIIEEIEGAGIIELMLEEAVRLRYIGVDILEPRLPTDHPPADCWAIDNVELGLAE